MKKIFSDCLSNSPNNTFTFKVVFYKRIVVAYCDGKYFVKLTKCVRESLCHFLISFLVSVTFLSKVQRTVNLEITRTRERYKYTDA